MTLLELLIVLLLLSLMLGLVAPQVVRQVESAQRRSLLRHAREVVEALPMRAFRGGQALDVAAEDLQGLLGDEWPSSVRLVLKQPLHYGATGIAAGGEIRVMDGQQALAVWWVEPMSGRLEEVAAR